MRKLVGWAVVVVLVVIVAKSCGIDLIPFSDDGCDAASDAVAHAESSECEDLKQAALDPNWATQQQERPELVRGKTTTGLFFELSPDDYIALSSGSDDLSERAASLLRDIGYDNPDPNPATHVEAKIAAKMHDASTLFGVLVINNTFVCGGCNDAVRALLPEGATLWIWTKSARQVLVIKGRG
ncbi:DddA-like double-stranded DNA deaminase toxin [Actinophytocola sp.]|uniref:DddA-like double-stranded DNA deaminase toxin n=1 Tax=Actinophytocola sp. TaxID=1872138 RepID=UPI0025B8D7EA|nr:DddA-like double-stranded DNA deaminase toxin [Actinophytocola sp.]